MRSTTTRDKAPSAPTSQRDILPVALRHRPDSHQVGPSLPPWRRHVGPALVAGALLFLLAAAFLLRVRGINFGLPEYVYHPDEWAVVEHAAKMLRTGDFNPHWFQYPSGYMYTVLLADIAYFLYGAAQGLFISLPDGTPPQFYLVARLTTALLGTLIVLVVYHIGRTARSTLVGLLAAAFAAFSYLSVVHSHYATTDIPATFVVALCTLFATLVLTQGRLTWYLLAGFSAGIAAGTKYNAGLVLLLLPLAHLLALKRPDAFLDHRLVLGLLAAPLGFLLATPYALFDLPSFLNGLAFELHHYHDYQTASMGLSGLWYARAVFASADAPLAMAYVAGIVSAFVRPSRTRLLLVGFPLLYYAALARTPVHFERNLLPMLPALSVLAALALQDVADAIVRLVRPAWLSISFVALIAALLLALPLNASYRFGSAIMELDVRPRAGAWIAETVPAGATIAIERYGFPLPKDRYSVVNIGSLWDHSAQWYAEQGFDYLIASNGVWRTLLSDPNARPNEVELAAFHDVSSRYTLVAEYAPQGVPRLLIDGYPTIAEYHFPHIWVFRIAPPETSGP